MLMDLQQVGIIHNALFLSLFLDVRFSGDLWAQQKKRNNLQMVFWAEAQIFADILDLFEGTALVYWV